MTRLTRPEKWVNHKTGIPLSVRNIYITACFQFSCLHTRCEHTFPPPLLYLAVLFVSDLPAHQEWIFHDFVVLNQILCLQWTIYCEAVIVPQFTHIGAKCSLTLVSVIVCIFNAQWMKDFNVLLVWHVDVQSCPNAAKNGLTALKPRWHVMFVSLD